MSIVQWVKDKIQEHKETLPERREKKLQELETKRKALQADAEYQEKKQSEIFMINEAQNKIKNAKAINRKDLNWERFGEGGVL